MAVLEEGQDEVEFTFNPDTDDPEARLGECTIKIQKTEDSWLLTWKKINSGQVDEVSLEAPDRSTTDWLARMIVAGVSSVEDYDFDEDVDDFLDETGLYEWVE